ncbi:MULTISPECIES: YbhN family protein [unclassified Cupriavidus]|uniref:lysylphosphatidylglycerol synthase transmembrane domain-containing protein n=1 Tax=unclassified Cupriavidus TaxID=2640874 RepID=UPI001365C70D|nr:YbhN family protein [Cupriavidus sp. SW-Y-13]MWL89856.1 UPF0104 family protein [Cupriavidus sp. SW-Y-13]
MTSTVHSPQRSKRQVRWSVAKRVAGLAFVAIVVVLIWRSLSGIDWNEVWGALKSYRFVTLLPAIGLACLSFTLHASFDLLGRRYTGHHLSAWRTMLIAWLAYVFNLNVGAMIGGIGMRLRLYTRSGVSASQVAGVYTIAVVTNWTGYMILAGLMFVWQPPVLPKSWGISPWLLQVIGAGMLVSGAAYLVACATLRQRSIKVRGRRFRLPTFRFAVMQTVLSIVNWVTLGTLINLLLPPQVTVPAALTALLVGAVAGALAHIPAGIGVLESVFVVMLGHVVPESTVVAALICYRALYYLLPMVIATAVYGCMELRGARRDRPDAIGSNP